MHTFKYSPKKGTVAEKMDGQVEGNIKEQRSEKIISLSDKNQLEYNKGYIGKKLDVLFEEMDENGYFKGHTSNYIVVKVKTNKNLENKILKIKIKDVDGLDLIGE